MSWRDDPIDEPWYELNFCMSRWTCPNELPSTFLDDVVEAIHDMDRILLDSMRLVDDYSYGVESSPVRYIRESAYEVFRGEFERVEDQFLVAQTGLAARWSSILLQHRELIASLPEEMRNCLRHPEAAYAINYSVTEVELNENLKQFLEGIQSGIKR